MSTLIPTSALSTAGVWGLLLAMVVALVKVWPALKKIQTESDSSLRENLLGRIKTLETRLDTISEFHAAEMGVMRHRLNNESASFDALLNLLKSGANFAPETLERIETTRADAARFFANEMNTITAARLAAAGKDS